MLRGLQRGMIGGMMGSTSALMGAGAAFGAVALAGRAAIRTYEDYSRAQARMRGILASTGTDLRGQRILMESADMAARRYGLGMADAAEAMNIMAETGVGVHGASRYFQIASEFATAANTDVTDASNVLVSSMRQFNMMSEEGARTLAGSFTMAARMSSTSISELQNAFRYAATEFATFGYSAQETVSALAGLSAIGIKASSAGTRLRRMMYNLINVTPSARQELARFGITSQELNELMFDSSGQLRGFVDLTRRMAGMFQGLQSQQAKMVVARRLFGVRAGTAGMLFARLHSQGDRWLQVYRELNDETRAQNLLTEAANQNMRGFAAQMNLARTAAQEFGITFMEMVFGSMDNAEQGFGTYLRDLALAVRFQDQTVDHTDAMTTAYAQLSPEIRETATEVREVMLGLSDFLKELWAGIKAVAKFASEYPRLSAALVGVMIVGPPVLGMLGSMVTIIGGLGKVFIWLGGAVKGGTVAATAGAGTVIAAFAAIAGLSLGTVVGEWIADLMGFGDELDAWDRQMNTHLDNWKLGWTQQVPILASIVRLLYRIGDTATIAGRQLARALNIKTFVGQDVLDERVAGMQRVHTGMGAGEATQRAASLELNETMIEMVGALKSRTDNAIQAERQFLDSIRGQNLSQEQTENLLTQFHRIYNTQIADEFNETASRFNGDLIVGSRAIGTFVRAMQMSSPVSGAGGAVAGSTTPVQDAYITRTGYLSAPVSAGDMFVNRDSLARAIATPAGGLAGATSAQQIGATPQSQQPVSNTTNAQLELNIPVTVDGREIARAVGNYNLQVDERRGVSITPGSRRRVMENGAR
jgi:TP901 family phage tail tape measure protein